MAARASSTSGLTLFAIPWVVLPLWMVIVNALKPLGEAQALSLSLPETWAFGDNLDTVVDDGHYLTGLRNSVLDHDPGDRDRAAARLDGGVGVRAHAVALAESGLLPDDPLGPAAAGDHPVDLPAEKIGLDGTRLGYALITISARIGLVIFLTTGFVRALPEDLEDAASIDGAGPWQTYRHVLLPLLRPILLVGGVILMITVWNDFFFALFLLQGEDSATLPLTLFQFASSTVDTLSWNLVFMHVVLTSLPLIVVYLFVQRRVLSGLTEGAVKG